MPQRGAALNPSAPPSAVPWRSHPNGSTIRPTAAELRARRFDRRRRGGRSHRRPRRAPYRPKDPASAGTRETRARIPRRSPVRSPAPLARHQAMATAQSARVGVSRAASSRDPRGAGPCRDESARLRPPCCLKTRSPRGTAERPSCGLRREPTRPTARDPPVCCLRRARAAICEIERQRRQSGEQLCQRRRQLPPPFVGLQCLTDVRRWIVQQVIDRIRNGSALRPDHVQRAEQRKRRVHRWRGGSRRIDFGGDERQQNAHLRQVRRRRGRSFPDDWTPTIHCSRAIAKTRASCRTMTARPSPSPNGSCTSASSHRIS